MLSSPDDGTSTMSMEEEEESQFSDAPYMNLQMDTDCEVAEESEGAKGSEGDVSRQKSAEEGVKAKQHIDQHRHTQYWESVMEESEGLSFDDPHSGSDTTITRVDSQSVSPSSPCDKSGDSPTTMSSGSAPCSQESPMEAEEMPPLTATVTMPASSADAMEIHASSPSLTTCKVDACIWASSVRTTSAGLLHLLVHAQVHHVRINTKNHCVWLLPRIQHFQCMTYVHLQKCLYIYVYYRNECQCCYGNGHVHHIEGVMLNAHGVNVSVVNNDASASLVYSRCCSVSTTELSCCEI